MHIYYADDIPELIDDEFDREEREETDDDFATEWSNEASDLFGGR